MGLEPPWDHRAQGPAAPQRGRALEAGSSLSGNTDAKQQQVFFFPGCFMGEQQRGRLSRLPHQMLRAAGAAGDGLEPSCDATR